MGEGVPARPSSLGLGPFALMRGRCQGSEPQCEPLAGPGTRSQGPWVLLRELVLLSGNNGVVDSRPRSTQRIWQPTGAFGRHLLP